MFKDGLSMVHLCHQSSDLKVPVSFPHKTNLSRLLKIDSGHVSSPPSPNPLEFLNLIPCAYPEAFVQRGYGKRKEIKQLASKAFAFNRALCSCFSSKVQT